MERCKKRDCYYCTGQSLKTQTCDYYIMTGKHREKEPPDCPHYIKSKEGKRAKLPDSAYWFTYET